MNLIAGITQDILSAVAIILFVAVALFYLELLV